MLQESRSLSPSEDLWISTHDIILENNNEDIIPYIYLIDNKELLSICSPLCGDTIEVFILLRSTCKYLLNILTIDVYTSLFGRCLSLWYADNLVNANFLPNNLRHGLYTKLKGKILKECTYILGIKNGKQTKWSITTLNIIEECTFKNGKKYGAYSSWYPNGSKRERCNYIADRRYGVYTLWFENSEHVCKAITFDDDMRNGLSVTWHPEGGGIYKRGIYNDNRRYGLYQTLTSDGKIYNSIVVS